MSTDPSASSKAGGVEDDLFEVDVSEVEELSFHIPPGTYPAKLNEVTKETSSNGNPMWTWEYEIIGSGDHRGFRLWNRTVLTKKAMWKVNETLRALHLRDEQGHASFGRDDAINRKVVLEVEDSEYQGDLRSQIAKVLEHPDGPDKVQSAPGEPDF